MSHKGGYVVYQNFKKVIGFINSVDDFSLKDAVEATKVPKSSVNTCILQLMDEGLVKIIQHVSIGSRTKIYRKTKVIE